MPPDLPRIAQQYQHMESPVGVKTTSPNAGWAAQVRRQQRRHQQQQRRRQLHDTLKAATTLSRSPPSFPISLAAADAMARTRFCCPCSISDLNTLMLTLTPLLPGGHVAGGVKYASGYRLVVSEGRWSRYLAVYKCQWNIVVDRHTRYVRNLSTYPCRRAVDAVSMWTRKSVELFFMPSNSEPCQASAAATPVTNRTLPRTKEHKRFTPHSIVLLKTYNYLPVHHKT